MTTDALWSAFSGRLRGFIAKRVREDVDIDDVLQDVFVKLHAGLKSLKDDDALEAWIFQVARRAVIDHHRGRTRRPEELGDPAERKADADLSAQVASWLEPMMSALPDEDREALKLADLQGLSRKDLAERLGLSLTGAKSRVQRARQKLKAALLECCHLELDRRGAPVDFLRKRADCGPCSCDPG